MDNLAPGSGFFHRSGRTRHLVAGPGDRGELRPTWKHNLQQGPLIHVLCRTTLQSRGNSLLELGKHLQIIGGNCLCCLPEDVVVLILNLVENRNKIL